jgi:exodeoxyribonuclease VII large subunit
MPKREPVSSLPLPFDDEPGDAESPAGRALPRPQARRAAEAQRAPRPVEEVPLTVSELLGYVSDTLRTEYVDVLVVGELTSFKRHASGHCYFTLADEDACIEAVMWRSAAGRLTFDPQVGDEVLCRGTIDVYPKQGRMQLYAQALRPVGAGAAQRAFEELKRRLTAEGLFEEARKRPLPFFPQTIGLVTSRTGAAVHDVLTTIRRRCRHCRVILSPATVQGPEAAREMLAALRALERLGACDVVIIGRGGGASEDLSAFNDEALVRAVAAFAVPVVSAVGHEVDFTLCDFAADRRAPTPTAAAELVVPVHADLCEDLTSFERRLHAAAHRYVENLRHRAGNLAGKLRDPARLVAVGRQRSDEMSLRMERALVARHRRGAVALERLHERLRRVGSARAAQVERTLMQLEARLEHAIATRGATARTALVTLASKLDALSPLAVLERGYSLALNEDGRLVRAADELAPGDTLALRFHRGSAETRVVSVSAGADPAKNTTPAKTTKTTKKR